MKRGLFRHAEIAFARYDNQDVMINGQHQCHAIIDSGCSVPAIIEHFRLNSQTELSEAFRQYDTHLMRSMRDMVHAEADSLGCPWPSKVSELLVAAIRLECLANPASLTSVGKVGSFGENRLAAVKLSREAIVDKLSDYQEDGKFIYHILSGGTNDRVRFAASRHLQRAPVIWVMMKSARKSKEDAIVFWSRVRDGEMLSKDDVAYKLREFLCNTSAVSMKRLSYRKANVREFAYRCAVAWNAFRQKRDLKVLKYQPDRPIPALQ